MPKGKFKTKGIIIIVLLALIVLWGISKQASDKSANKLGAIFTPNDVKIISLGKSIYNENCASCHGIKLEGAADWKSPNNDGLMPAPPHDESGHTWHHTDALLFDITKYGLAKITNNENYKTNMPVYESILSDDEIIAVLSYIKSTWSNEIKQRHDELNAASVKVQ